MKKIIYTAAFTLLIASSAIAVQKPANKADLNSASIVHSGAHPNNANIQLATHHFEIYVQERSLTELLIELPPGIKISEGIRIANQSGQKIAANVSIDDQEAIILFSQPVPAETTLSIEMQGIHTLGFPRTWMYHISGKLGGLTEEIPLGTARIQTYQ